MADVRWRHQLRTGNDTNDPSPLSKPTTERHNTIYNGTGHTYIGPEARWPALLYTSDPPSVFKTIDAKRPGHKVVVVYLFLWGRPLNEHKNHDHERGLRRTSHALESDRLRPQSHIRHTNSEFITRVSRSFFRTFPLVTPVYVCAAFAAS